MVATAPAPPAQEQSLASYKNVGYCDFFFLIKFNTSLSLFLPFSLAHTHRHKTPRTSYEVNMYL